MIFGPHTSPPPISLMAEGVLGMLHPLHLCFGLTQFFNQPGLSG